MKRIIRGRLYDTETAREVAEWSDRAPGDFRHVEEVLFRKRTGEYFLHGYGGPMTRYGERERYGDGVGYGSAILPLSFDEAREWAEEHMGADAYQEEFGPAPEGEGEAAHIHVTVSEAARRALDSECARTGETRSAIVERLLSGLLP